MEILGLIVKLDKDKADKQVEQVGDLVLKNEGAFIVREENGTKFMRCYFPTMRHLTRFVSKWELMIAFENLFGGEEL